MILYRGYDNCCDTQYASLSSITMATTVLLSYKAQKPLRENDHHTMVTVITKHDIHKYIAYHDKLQPSCYLRSRQKLHGSSALKDFPATSQISVHRNNKTTHKRTTLFDRFLFQKWLSRPDSISKMMDASIFDTAIPGNLRQNFLRHSLPELHFTYDSYTHSNNQYLTQSLTQLHCHVNNFSGSCCKRLMTTHAVPAGFLQLTVTL
jgi:hypothetical protein